MASGRRRLSRTARGVVLSVSLAIACAAAIAVGIALVPDPTPDAASARAAVEASFTRVVSTLPDAHVVEVTQSFVPQPCPVEDKGSLIAGTSFVQLDGDFDRQAWVGSLAERFPDDDGWYLSVGSLGAADQYRIRLVGADLSIVTMQLTANAGGSNLALEATSACTRA